MSINPNITTVAPHQPIQNGVSIHNWSITSSKQPILTSTELDTLQAAVKLDKLPDMVFGRNYARFHHPSTGFEINLNALDGVRYISKQADPSIKVSHSEKWAAGNKANDYIEKSFNWTFTTDYQGTILVNDATPQSGSRVGSIELTDEQINVDKLKSQDPILHYDEMVLYEDELGDNGSSVLTARVRVMPSLFFALLRFWLRVDGVIYRASDVRLYHEFGKDYILREIQHRECPYEPLKERFTKEPATLHDANILVPLLPLKESYMEKIFFKP